MAKIENLTPFTSDYRPGNPGRKKKIYTILKEKGYSKDDIVTAYGELAFYDIDELEKIKEDKTKPIITRIVAKQFIECFRKCDWLKIKDIIEHLTGKPMQKTDNNITIDKPAIIDLLNPYIPTESETTGSAPIAPEQ